MAVWVVFGTLAVLRSSAVNTGQTVGRALLGTAIGFVLGVALILTLDTHPVALWLLLPLSIVLIGLEPSVMSFTAGQAVLLILFTIVDPVGWQIGLVRIKDIALGCAVSLVVGALFWLRGAGPALGRVLSEAFGDGARYLRTAVVFGLTAATVPRSQPRILTRTAAEPRDLHAASTTHSAGTGGARREAPAAAQRDGADHHRLGTAVDRRRHRRPVVASWLRSQERPLRGARPGSSTPARVWPTGSRSQAARWPGPGRPHPPSRCVARWPTRRCNRPCDAT